MGHGYLIILQHAYIIWLLRSIRSNCSCGYEIIMHKVIIDVILEKEIHLINPNDIYRFEYVSYWIEIIICT